MVGMGIREIRLRADRGASYHVALLFVMFFFVVPVAG